MKNIIEIKNLSKSFRDVKAVDNLSFEVREGELFAFLGVNGAGKSTTINIISGSLTKDSGEVYIDGVNTDSAFDRVKSEIGIVFQSSVLDKHLTVYDNLKSRAAIYGITGEAFEGRLRELEELLELQGLMKRTLGKLSGGQRRRIDIARALLHSPRILILDEPTTGLDPQTRRLLWQVIERLRVDEGLTVFLTTHYMEEAAEAGYVVIIDGGRIAARGTPLDLKRQYASDYLTVYGRSAEELSVLSLPLEEVRDGYRISVDGTAKITELILRHPTLFQDYEVTKGRMDDVFLAVTGKAFTTEEGRK